MPVVNDGKEVKVDIFDAVLTKISKNVRGIVFIYPYNVNCHHKLYQFKLYYHSYKQSVLCIGQELDTAASSLLGTPERLKLCDFTTSWIWTENYSLIGPKPAQESRLFAFIRPFDSMV